jgi:GNAT superfamily N-acetyltransferase
MAAPERTVGPSSITLPAARRVERITGGARKSFADILKHGFSADQRDKTSVVLANIAEGRRDCFVVRGDGQTLLGLAVLQPLKGLDVVLLEYLAVAPTFRDRGIGGQLFDCVVADYQKTTIGIVLQVEAPSAAKGAERDVRTRRVEFYRRHGADVVTGAPSYRAPCTRGSGLLRYDLMWRPLGQRVKLSGELLRACVTAILTQSYELPPDGRFVQRTVKRLTL